MSFASCVLLASMGMLIGYWFWPPPPNTQYIFFTFVLPCILVSAAFLRIAFPPPPEKEKEDE